MFLEPLTLAGGDGACPLSTRPTRRVRQEVILGRAVRKLSGRTEAGRAALCRLPRLPAGHPLSTARQATRCAFDHDRGTSRSRRVPVAGIGRRLIARASDCHAKGRPETDASTCHVEITWTAPAPGRVPLPLRPPSSMGLEILDACRVASDRPNPWCLIALRLARNGSADGAAHGILGTGRHLPEPERARPTVITAFRTREASLIQRCSETRVWWGGGEYLDPFLVLESLRHGCLPLQCVPQAMPRRAGRLPSSRPFPLHPSHPRRGAHSPDFETGTGRENRPGAIDPPGGKPGAQTWRRSFLP